MTEKNDDNSPADAGALATIDVLRTVFEALSDRNSPAAEILLEMAEDGRIESHQTSGTLAAIADELLATTELPES